MTNPIIPFNSYGIFGIESVGTPTATATEVILNFTPHPNVNAPYNGVLIVNLATAIPTGTTGTLPVIFQTGNRRVAATNTGGVPLTVADLPGSGYYFFFYDSERGIFQKFSA